MRRSGLSPWSHQAGRRSGVLGQGGRHFQPAAVLVDARLMREGVPARRNSGGGGGRRGGGARSRSGGGLSRAVRSFPPHKTASGRAAAAAAARRAEQAFVTGAAHLPTMALLACTSMPVYLATILEVRMICVVLTSQCTWRWRASRSSTSGRPEAGSWGHGELVSGAGGAPGCGGAAGAARAAGA